jgi:hypothetical protein
MKWDPLREFFSHIAEREKTFENADIFHFQHVEEGRKERRSDGDDGTIEESGAGPEDGNAAEGAGHADGAEDNVNAGGGDDAGTARGDQGSRISEGPDGSTTHAAGPLPNAKTGKKKKTKKTQASPTKKKRPQKTPNQPTTLPSPEGTGGAEPPAPPRPKAHPQPRLVTRPVTNLTQEPTEITGNQAPPQSIPVPAAAGTEALPRARPRARPKARPATDATQGRQETTTNAKSTSIPTARTAGGAGVPSARNAGGAGASVPESPAHEEQPSPPTKQAQGGVPDAVIDRSLRPATNQPSRATSDNLALQEAGRFAVKGKRVPKKKQQV